MTNHIEILLYSYRNKNLPAVIDNLYKYYNDNNFTLTIVDQNNINRENLFGQLENVVYKFRKWDSIKSPCLAKMNFINNATAKYAMIVSDDISMSDGWYETLIDFCDSHENVVVSGHTIANIYQKDLFSIANNPIWDNKFALSQFIDRNFIFGKTEVLQKATYPGELKYAGEEEVYSISLLGSGVDIYSAPSQLYFDTNVRTLDNLYVPFSKEHNYNKFYEYINHPVAARFNEYHKINPSMIKLLPDFNNDVEYLHTDLEFASLDGNKFIEKPNRIE